MKISKKTLALAGAAVVAAGTMSFVTFVGDPRWPLIGPFHYIVDLHPTSFPTTGTTVWSRQARKALSDWESSSVGGTSYTPGWRSNASDAGNHLNGQSTWIWTSAPTESWLGVTFVRYAPLLMLDCDVWYNSRIDYPWTPLRTNPCPSQATSPYSFRGVAIHEHGHALGLDHETRTLATMQPIYSTGTAVMHADAAADTEDFSFTGMLPHADDKAGLRYLYGSTAAAYNLMATNWSPSVGQYRLTGTFAAGAPITLPGVTLENMSNRVVTGNAAGVKLGVYLSTNSIISSSDTLINEYYFSGDWPAHSSNFYTALGGTIPVTTTPGSYYVGVLFDNTALVGEGPRANFDTTAAYGADNAAECGQITVTAAPMPDLTPILLGASSTNFRRGDPITMSSTIQNVGTAASPACTSGYYLSLDSTVTTADTLLSSFTTNALATSGTHAHSGPATVPLSTPVGPCWLGVIADRLGGVGELNEGNNTRALAAYCQDVATADLTPTLLGASSTNFRRGDPISINSTIQNVGTAVSPSCTSGYYLSLDATITTADTLLSSFTTNALAVNGTHEHSVPASVPLGTPIGPCWLGVIADRLGGVSESNESNNTRALAANCQAGIPDLDIVEVMLIDDKTIDAGGVEVIGVTTRNIGNDDSPASVTGIFLSADRSITTGDLFLGQVAVPTLQVNGTYGSKLNVAISACQRAGLCYLGAIADYQGLVSELNEANQARAGGPYECLAVQTKGGLVQFQTYLGTAAIANDDSRFALRGGPRSASMCLAAPNMPGYWYMLIMSGNPSPKFAYDAWSDFSLSLLNGPVLPAWFGILDGSGYAEKPQINLPRVAIAARLESYTHSIYFSPKLTFVGFGQNSVRNVIGP